MTARLWPSWYKPFAAQPERPISMARVQDAICQHFGCTISELTGPRGDAKLSSARQLGYLACREIGRRSFPLIGRAFGNRDHSTIAVGIHTAKKRVANNPAWAGHYACIKVMLG